MTRQRRRPRHPLKMGTGPNGHGTPSTATAPAHVNGLIGNNETHFCHGNGAVSSRVKGCGCATHDGKRSRFNIQQVEY